MSNNTKADIDAAREYYETHSVEDEIERSVPGEMVTSAMSGYSVRLPTDVLEQARKFAADRGMTTGAWLREAIENAVTAVDQPAASVPIAELAALVAKYDPSSKQRSAGSPYQRVTPGTVAPGRISGDALANWASTHPLDSPAFLNLVVDGRPVANLLLAPTGLSSPSLPAESLMAQFKSYFYAQEDAEDEDNTVTEVTVQHGTNPRQRDES